MAGSTTSPADKAEDKQPLPKVQIVCGPDPVFVTDHGPIYPTADGEEADPIEVDLTPAIQELLDSKAVVKHTAKTPAPPAKKETN